MKNRILYTTSREPSQRTRSFLKDMVSLSPYFIRQTRGKYTFDELVEIAHAEQARFLVVIGEKKGNPSIMRTYDLQSPENRALHTYTIFLSGVTLAREARNTRIEHDNDIDFYVAGKSPGDGKHRLLVIWLVEIFGASLSPPPASGDSHVIINLKPLWMRGRALLQVEFYQRGKRVGPIIRIWGVKKVGKPV